MHSYGNAGQEASSTQGSGIRILLVGDQEMFLAGLRFLLQSEPGITVVGQSMTAKDAFDAAAVEPDIVLFAPCLANEQERCLGVLSELITMARRARILVLTPTDDSELHVQAVALGAMGVLHAVASPPWLFKAIRKVHSGEMWVQRSVMTQVLQRRAGKVDPEAAKIASLTNREREVIRLLCEGRRNKQIAERLFVAECTVRHHLTAIFDKLGLSDRLDLLIYAFQHRLANTQSPVRIGKDGDLPRYQKPARKAG